MHAAQMCLFHGVLKFMGNCGEAVVSLVMVLRWRLLHTMPHYASKAALESGAGDVNHVTLLSSDGHGFMCMTGMKFKKW
jgi:hypothetical protein